MRHPERWRPSKYVHRRGRWAASSDLREVGIASRLITNAVAARYERYLPLYARGRLIDLGCGQVPLYGAYRDLVDTVTCVDWAASPHPSIHLDHELDLAAPLPFDDASFDTVLLSDVLEHVPSPERLWAEIARLLAPGGHLLMNVPFLYGIHEAPHDYGRYTEFALRRFASQVGLQVRVLASVGGSLHVMADLFAKHLAHVPLIGRWSAQAVQALVGVSDRSTRARRLSEATSRHFPLGYFMVARRPDDAGRVRPAAA